MRTPATISLHTDSAEATVAWSAKLGALLRAGDVLLLHGELGAGKTTLVRGLAQGLGLDAELVSSPTFVLLKEYEPGPDAPNHALSLMHMDAYRVQGPDELDTLGWGDKASELLRDAALAIEWPERLGDQLPAEHLSIHLTHDGNGRTLRLSWTESWAERADALTAL